MEVLIALLRNARDGRLRQPRAFIGHVGAITRNKLTDWTARRSSVAAAANAHLPDSEERTESGLVAPPLRRKERTMRAMATNSIWNSVRGCVRFGGALMAIAGFGSKAIFTGAACALLLWVGPAQAATDEEKCLAGRAKAKANYEKCVADQVGKGYGTSFENYFYTFLEKLAKCRIKYAGAWTKLQGLGTTCAVASRYTDNGNGTVTDNLTGLVWEKKSDDGDVHDKDTQTMWSTGPLYNGNGTAFTTFLRDGLNAGAGFAGANDWRLPTFVELQTILLPEEYPCTTSPCVDAVFNTSCAPGCTVLTCSCPQELYNWSATTFAGLPTDAWLVSFLGGGVHFNFKAATNYARAVRGGL